MGYLASRIEVIIYVGSLFQTFLVLFRAFASENIMNLSLSIMSKYLKLLSVVGCGGGCGVLCIRYVRYVRYYNSDSITCDLAQVTDGRINLAAGVLFSRISLGCSTCRQ